MRHRLLAAAAAAACVVLSGCGGTSPSASPTTTSPTTTEPDFYDSPAPVTMTSPPTVSWTAPVAPPTTEAPPATTASTGGCSLPHTGDLIWWEKWPGTPAQVSMLGDVNIVECRYSWETLAETEPSGPGYCDILARPSDNPGYDMNAVPPARPRNILAQAGAGC